tara:strand:- start:48 stop:704 length:657 start_codon:yes stop_codon:yes gene_type:complete
MANRGKFNDRSITDFRNRLSGGGARPNLFEVNIALPAGVDGFLDYEKDINFMVKAAEIPASNIGNIPVPFRGRVLPIAGDRTFDPWTVTIINDQKFNIRASMELWANRINDLEFAGGDINPADYQTNAQVFQLGRSTNKNVQSGGEGIPILREYRFEGIYPNTVSSIPLDYGATDQIEEFQVTFNYLFWTVAGGLRTKGNNNVTANSTVENSAFQSGI